VEFKENIMSNNDYVAEVNSSRVFKKAIPWKNVVASNTAVLNFNLGNTYDSVLTKYTGITLAQMKNIKVKIGVKTVMEFKDGEEIELINKFFNRKEKAGYLTLHFVQQYMNTLAQRQMFAVSTNGIASFTLEFDIDAAAVNPKLESSVIISPAKLIVDNSRMLKFRRINSQAMVAGVNDMMDIPNIASIAQIFFLKDDVEKVELLADGIELLNIEKETLQIYQEQARHERVPDNDYTCVDWTLGSTPHSAIAVQGVQDLHFKLTCTTAGVMDILIAYYDHPFGKV
jgi:hypothetical protein